MSNDDRANEPVANEPNASNRHEERPDVWVGHIALGATDVSKSAGFWAALGMRSIHAEPGVAILELRGGTHLVLLENPNPVPVGAAAPFDIMVDDIHATHARYAELGFAPSEMEHDETHDSFTLLDPSGYRVTVNSTHVSGHPV